MLNIEVSPENFSLIFNELFYRVESDARTTLKLTVDSSASSAEFFAYPDANDLVRFQSGLAEYIESQLSSVFLPDLTANTQFDISSYLLATLDAELDNGVDAPIVLDQITIVAGAGTSADVSTLPIFWYYQGPAMTLKYTQRFPVLFYIDVANTQNPQMRLRFNDTSYYINLVGLGNENMIDLSPKSLETLFLVNLGTAKSYSIKIEAENLSSSILYNSQELFFNIDHRSYVNTRTFAFKNPMGAIELMTCTGRRQESKLYTKEIAEREIYADSTEPETFYFSTETEVNIRQQTGILGKNAKAIHAYYQYFFESNQVYEVINNTYVPVLVQAQEYEFLNDDLKLYGFTFQARKI